MSASIRALFLSLVGAWLWMHTPPAHAAGTLIVGDGSYVGGSTEDAALSTARAVLFQQDTTVTAIMQAATDELGTIGSAWVLPIHGSIVMAPTAASPAILSELIRATDPIFEPPFSGDSGVTIGCDDSIGCSSSGSDSAEQYFAPYTGLYDTNQAGATWSHYGPSAVDAATDSLRNSGYDVTDELADQLSAHAADGGSVVIMFFTEESTSASPALVVRYTADALLLPQATTPLSAAEYVQTTVLTITDAGAAGPVGVPHAIPRLGDPLYPVDQAPDFYAARMLAALEDAGPDAWLLEYSNTLESLEARSDLLDEISGEGASLQPWYGLDRLADEALLDRFDPSDVWITRWRTIQSSDVLTDLVFAPDDSVPSYEVYVEGSLFEGGGFWPVSLLMTMWVFQRRVRRTTEVSAGPPIAHP